MRLTLAVASMIAMGCSGAGGGSGGPDAAVGPDAPTTHPCPTAEHLLEGNVTLENTLDIAALAGYTRITGDLVIHTQGLATVALPELCAVDGSLSLRTTDLATLSIANLGSVGAGVDIWAVSALDLRNLSSVTGNLWIVQTGLTDLGGLSELQSIGGDLDIGDNPVLSNVDGLSHLTDIPGRLSIGGATAAPLSGAGGLSHITHVGGDLDVNGSNWTDLAPLAGLVTIGGGFQIWSTTPFSTAGAPSLASIGGPLQLGPNPGGGAIELTFPALASVGSIDIQEPVSRVHLPSLTSIGMLDLEDQAGLTEVNLPAVTTAYGVRIMRDPVLTTVNLSALASSLPSVGFADLPMVTSVDLGSLDSTYGVALVRMPALTTFDAHSLRSGQVDLEHCDALPSLDLPLLTTARDIIILDNATLASLHLPMLDTVAMSYTVSRNPLLPQCEVAAILAGLSAPVSPQMTQMFGNNGVCPP